MDVYFEPEYGKLNEQIEGGTAETFRFTCEYGAVESTYIKRAIPQLVRGERYFDAVTPYGYGGAHVVECSDRERLLGAYKEAYLEHCAQEKLVCEFVRFHPLAGNARDFGQLYDVSFNRSTVAIDLTDENYAAVQFSPECRNMIRKAQKKGVSVELDCACEHLDEFMALYYATMDKNGASDYYYFKKPYFESLARVPGTRLMLINARAEGRIIASAMFMVCKELMHYHLSSTDPAFYSYAANNLILAEAARYGRENGLLALHLGGGLSPDESDRLFRFKRSFGRTPGNLREFYIGKGIFLPDVYDELCRSAGSGDDFFPAYRKAH